MNFRIEQTSIFYNKTERKKKKKKEQPIQLSFTPFSSQILHPLILKGLYSTGYIHPIYIARVV